MAYLESIDDTPASAPLPTTTFAGWAEVTPGATGDPNSNTDGDQFTELLEFALGGNPNSADSPASDAVTCLKSNAGFKLQVRCPVGLKGLTMEVLTSGNLTTWTPAPVIPTVQMEPGGTEIMTFDNLQNQPGITPAAGYARLRVIMDNAPPP